MSIGDVDEVDKYEKEKMDDLARKKWRELHTSISDLKQLWWGRAKEKDE